METTYSSPIPFDKKILAACILYPDTEAYVVSETSEEIVYRVVVKK